FYGNFSFLLLCSRWFQPHNVSISLTIALIAIPFSPTDKSPDEDTSPKPTVFLPSPAERTLHKTGTYLCLLEDFFPDVIKVDWKEKNGKTILKSQQGNTVKTKDTYMKYTWLTVTEKSMDKEHNCIVKHEKNKGGVDQEILFPSINTELPAINSTEASLKDENGKFLYVCAFMLCYSIFSSQST
uniref:Ig-like domain-containing protein n=1 Tax=Lynx canadensis TaxID=61383 RepID=A0A667HAE4_LYNCA